jgi:phosphoribosylformylglycinamidine cyclo-ligase
MTKCIRFGSNVHFIKDNLLPVPPIFKAIREASKTDAAEMHRVYNMGQRLEIYVEENDVPAVRQIADSLGIVSQVVGRTEASKKADGANHITLTTADGEIVEY